MANLSHCQLVGDAKIGKDASQDEIGQTVDMRHLEEIAKDKLNGYGIISVGDRLEMKYIGEKELAFTCLYMNLRTVQFRSSLRRNSQRNSS